MQKTPPIRSSKLSPMVKTLDQFGFITQKQGRIAIHARGKHFRRSEASVRKAVIRTLFAQVDLVQNLLAALKAAPTGRLHRAVINDSFNSVSKTPIAESTEVLSFILWAQLCELFGYEKKQEELIRVDSMVPAIHVRSSRSSACVLRLV